MFNLKNKKFLVTGGAGFVGSNIVERILDCGGEVTVLDDLTTGSLTNIDSKYKYKFVQGSVTDYPTVEKLMKEVDYVLHLATRGIIVSTAEPMEDYEVNIGGTLNVLMAARKTKPKKVLYTSTTSIYGNPKIIPITEDEPPVTLSPYAVSKLAGENYFRVFYELFDVPTVVVRYSNIYGPKQDVSNPYCGVIAKFMDNLEKGKRPLIHGDGQQTRDFTYVDDAVEGTLLALFSERAEGDNFNLGSGTETSIETLATKILTTMRSTDMELAYIDRRDIDNIRRRVVNIEKARTRLKWSPQVTLVKGLEKTKKWFLSK